MGKIFDSSSSTDVAFHLVYGIEMKWTICKVHMLEVMDNNYQCFSHTVICACFLKVRYYVNYTHAK